MNPQEIRQHLFASLRQRLRPEDVAESVLGLLRDQLETDERRLLEKAAHGSLRRAGIGYSSMSSSFREVVGFDRQFTKAREFFTASIPAAGEEARIQLGRVKEVIPGGGGRVRMSGSCNLRKRLES